MMANKLKAIITTLVILLTLNVYCKTGSQELPSAHKVSYTIDSIWRVNDSLFLFARYKIDDSHRGLLDVPRRVKKTFYFADSLGNEKLGFGLLCNDFNEVGSVLSAILAYNSNFVIVVPIGERVFTDHIRKSKLNYTGAYSIIGGKLTSKDFFKGSKYRITLYDIETKETYCLRKKKKNISLKKIDDK